MTTPADLQAQVIAAQQALAAADAAVLSAFANSMATGTFTVATFTQDFGALAAQLGDPGRQAAVNNCYQAFVTNLNNFNALVTAAQAAAQ